MYSLKKIAYFLGLECDRFLPLSSFAIDSREVQKGGVFFALKGEKVDGHNFLFDVARRGAFAAVVDKNYKGDHFGLHLFYVDDVLVALQEIARKSLLERKTRIIGVTGSVGKTTTKEFIYEILKNKFKVEKSIGSRNSQRTLPLAILNASGDEDFLVLEMSMSEKGNLKNLAKMAPPEIIVITPIVFCHAKNFQSLDEIAEAKSEIFTPKAEFAVIHEKSGILDPIIENCSCENDIYPQNLGFESPFKERHLTDNLSAAIEVGKYLGLTIEEMAISARRCKTLEHRFEKKKLRGILFIDDSYNATAASMIAALQNMPKPKENGKTIAVFGSMKELGEFSLESHIQVANEALDKVDILYCIGDETKSMVEVFEKNKKEVLFFSSYDLLKRTLFESAKEGDVVLVKGSNSHKLWQVIQ